MIAMYNTSSAQIQTEISLLYFYNSFAVHYVYITLKNVFFQTWLHTAVIGAIDSILTSDRSCS